MLNGWAILIGILFVLFFASTVLGQNVEVLKAELKGTEGRLDAKIDGVEKTLTKEITGTKNELNTKIDGVEKALTKEITGVKNELNASIDGVKSGVTIIQWIIGGIGVVSTIFLGFVGYLLNYFVKQLLPNMVQRESKRIEQTESGQPQQEPTSGENFADNTEPNYRTAEVEL